MGRKWKKILKQRRIDEQKKNEEVEPEKVLIIEKKIKKEVPEYSINMLKEELIGIAQFLEIEVKDDLTKKQLVSKIKKWEKENG